MLLAVALAVRLLVPQGYMPVATHQTLTVQLCHDGSAPLTTEIAIPLSGQERGQPGHGRGNAADSPCAFSSLGMGATGAVDGPLLALAIAFILALGFAAERIIPRARTRHVRPPLRGPPSLA